RRLGLKPVRQLVGQRNADGHVPNLRASCDARIRSPMWHGSGTRMAPRAPATPVDATRSVVTCGFVVETMGLEPTTPCLQSRCSSQLSYVPVPLANHHSIEQ